MAKCETKKWKIDKVSRDVEQFKLIELYKETSIKELKARKGATNDLASFKKWYFLYMKACELEDKVYTIWNEYDNLNSKTDEQKDWLQELKRACNTIEGNKADFQPGEIIRSNEKKVREFIEAPELKKYKVQILQDFIEGS